MSGTAVTASQREECAALVMQAMLEDYCTETGVSFNQAFLEFSSSTAYKELFDYSTGLWMEGPDYLRNVFEDTRKPTDSASA